MLDGTAGLSLARLAAVLAVLLCGCRHAAAPPAAKPAFDWVLDPSKPGPDYPPDGRSLFDALAPDPPPFPFPNLLAAIEARLGGRAASRRVLIPLGRSLQRSAGAPDFFRYPRAVVVYDGEPSAGIYVKDRLFMGYHERAGVIEVISYNERAGRFEFQLVKNYRAGGVPRVLYARRKVCTGCHQNQAPLFPRQLWDETNANPFVSRMLAAQKRSFYDFPAQQTADAPYQIDLAVHRANEFSTYQALWAAASRAQRAELLRAALRCRETGSCAPGPVLLGWAGEWKRQWPRGLAIPNPEIPNRNPLAILSREGPRDPAAAQLFLARRQMQIDAAFEPANPRQPLDFWYGEPQRVERLIIGLASFVPFYDVAALKRAGPQERDACAASPVFRPAAWARRDAASEPHGLVTLESSLP